MDKKLRIAILKEGGKKALKRYNETRRTPLPAINTAPREIESRKRKKEKYKAQYVFSEY